MVLTLRIPIAQPLIGIKEGATTIKLIRSAIFVEGIAVVWSEDKFTHNCDVKHVIAVNSDTADPRNG